MWNFKSIFVLVEENLKEVYLNLDFPLHTLEPPPSKKKSRLFFLFFLFINISIYNAYMVTLEKRIYPSKILEQILLHIDHTLNKYETTSCRNLNLHQTIKVSLKKCGNIFLSNSSAEPNLFKVVQCIQWIKDIYSNIKI